LCRRSEEFRSRREREEGAQREVQPCRPSSRRYHAVSEHLATFLAGRQLHGRPVPFFIVRDFRALLAGGVPAHGFLRVLCDDCGHDRVVPFSGKGRGFCPAGSANCSRMLPPPRTTATTRMPPASIKQPKISSAAAMG
jgi:ribosomal protein S27E